MLPLPLNVNGPGKALSIGQSLRRKMQSQLKHDPQHWRAQAASQQVGTEGLKEDYDVYIYEPEPLQQGIEKHVISVFVADESGLINRVAGVFARRGCNIESLAVGLTSDKALFTIVANNTPQVMKTLCKQLLRLVSVRYVEEVTHEDRIERELLLIKLRAPPGPARTELLQLAEIFRAKTVDVSERSTTLQLVGDPGKNLAFQRAIAKFGVLEVARTGRITLKRGEALLEDGAMQDSSRQRLRLRKMFNDSEDTEEEEEEAEPDVYSSSIDLGDTQVWEVDNILDAQRSELKPGSSLQPHTLMVEVDDAPGVLNLVTGVFARRGYNVQSLAVGNSEKPGKSRITMVVPGTTEGIANLVKQIRKVVCVASVDDLTSQPFVYRELALIKVRCMSSQRGEILNLVDIFRSSIVDTSTATLTIQGGIHVGAQVTGREEKMTKLQELLEPYGVLEVARTGRVALMRDSGVDSKFLARMSLTKI